MPELLALFAAKKVIEIAFPLFNDFIIKFISRMSDNYFLSLPLPPPSPIPL